MLLKGLQKTTLLDYPEKVACTVFTGGCNLRCPFCHNASLVNIVDNTEIDENEFFSFLKKRVNILDGVCITGGEPLLQKDIKEFISKIKALGYAVKLDTNGFYPQKLRELIEAGLVDYVAMDIKSSKSGYGRAVGIEDFDVSPVLESAELLLSGNLDFEFRTTLVRELHGEAEIRSIGEWIAGAPKYFLQTFEDSGDLISSHFSGYDKNETEYLLKLLKPYVPNAQIRG